MCLTSFARISVSIVYEYEWILGTYSSSCYALHPWGSIWCIVHMRADRCPHPRRGRCTPPSCLYRGKQQSCIVKGWYLLRYLALKSFAVILTFAEALPCPKRLLDIVRYLGYLILLLIIFNCWCNLISSYRISLTIFYIDFRITILMYLIFFNLLWIFDRY